MDKPDVREDGDSLRRQQLCWVRDMLIARAVPVVPEQWRDDPLLLELDETLREVRSATAALANGDLHYLCHGHGHVIGMLKTLQANLRHLTWQVQCVAEGQYEQRVDFMGEFSEAFNRMVTSLAAMRRDVEALSEEYRQALRHEALTGCYTVAAFQEMLCAVNSEKVSGSLLRLELDFFSDILNAGGAACGDSVLRIVGAAVQDAAHPWELCCRVSGTAFLLALPGMPCAQAVEKAEALRKSIEQQVFSCGGETLSVTVSVGVVPLPAASAEDLSALLHEVYLQAEDAVRQAVALGRNQVFCMETALHAQAG